MPDVFISYNREDRETARLVASGLEAEGFSVWWDAALRAGEYYEEVTEKNLRSAGAVVVLWSKRSAGSKWVRAEATVGERSSTLVPALIEECDRPVRFELVQTADLTRWRGDRNDQNWRAFMQDVSAAISRRSEKPAPSVAAAAPSSAQDASIETAFWNSIKDGTDRSDFEAYLQRYPHGHFAALANNRLAAMSKAPPVQPRAAAPRPTHAAAPSQSPRQAPPPAQQQRAAVPLPPKKSGNGLLISGIVGGLAVLGFVAFIMMKKDAEPVAAAAPAEVAAATVAEPSVAVPDTAPPELAPDSAAPPEEFVDVFAETDGETPAGDVAVEPEAVAAEIAAAPGEAASAAAPQTAAPVKASPGKTFRDCELCPLMASLPGGTFKMGSPSSEPGRNAYEGPQRDVTVKPFAIGVYEVTSAEWAACVAEGACSKKRADETGKLPALGISWRDASAYASWLSKKTGRKYRLPSESEWEYAARAGSSTAYWWGDKFDRARVSAREASAVGSYEANAFGLFDVLGNAREWVADCYVNNFVKAPTDGAAVTDGDCGKRVIRGGAWSSAPVDMRTANRSRIDSGVTAQYMGVRLAAELK